ncbi:MAG: hypothetical protein FWC06_03295 [Treponema sp.]|nr:hypothetical protein [Treponema sp.]
MSIVFKTLILNLPLEHPNNLFHTETIHLVIMEELQSTEILDREILDDARKKALRLLKEAEDTINTQNVQWEKEITHEIEKIEKKYKDQKESEIKSIMSRLPVDKQRAKIEKIESMLKTAVDAWYNSQSREQILELLSKELTMRLNYCKDQFKENDNFSIEAAGLDQKEIDVIIKLINKNYSFSISKSILTTAHSSFPSITVIADDVRIIASIEKTIDYILHEKREELIFSLTGSDFMRSA